MSGRTADRGRGSDRRVALTGAAAVVGAAVWIVTPWAQAAVYGDRPYVATAFDAASLLAWLLMAAGLVGVRAAFGERYGRLGRASVGATAVGMVTLGALSLRSVVVFVDAGFRAVPATGEDPAGLLLTWAALLGYGLVLAGAGGLGLSLRRVGLPRPGPRRADSHDRLIADSRDRPCRSIVRRRCFALRAPTVTVPSTDGHTGPEVPRTRRDELGTDRGQARHTCWTRCCWPHS